MLGFRRVRLRLYSRPVRQIVLKHRHCGGQQFVDVVRLPVRRAAQEGEMVDPQRSVGRNHVGAVLHFAVDRGAACSWRIVPFVRERIVGKILVRVHEVHIRIAAVQVKDHELYEVVRRTALVRQGLERLFGVDDNAALPDTDLLPRIERVVGAQPVELGDVVDAVAVEVARAGDLILLDAVLVRAERLQTVRQRRCAGLAARHGDGHLPRGVRPCRNRRVEHEVIVRGGSHDNRDAGHCHGHRSRRGITVFARSRRGAGIVAGAGAALIRRQCVESQEGGQRPRQPQHPTPVLPGRGLERESAPSDAVHLNRQATRQNPFLRAGDIGTWSVAGLFNPGGRRIGTASILWSSR